MTLYHTDKLLRKHKLLVKQSDDKFSLVDWETRKPVSKKRENAYFSESDRADSAR